MSEQNDNVAHHEGYSKGLQLALSICLCYTLCVLALRSYVRWKIFGFDDLAILLSTILAAVFFGCNYASNAAGLGRPIDTLNSQQGTIEKLNALILASNLSWITALCLSKMAIVLMLLRTTPTTSHQRLQYLAAALVCMQCVISVILMTAECTAFKSLAWSFRSNATACSSQSLRWQVITGLDIATELVVLALPLQLVWNLQMSTKNKFVVVAAFWLRIPTLVFTILRNRATGNLRHTSDVSLTAAMVVVWQTIEMSYSIAAATVAALKRFTESLNTGFGHGELIRVRGSSKGYKMSDRSASSKSSEPLKSTTSTEPLSSHSDEQGFQGSTIAGRDSQQLQLRPESLYNRVTVSTLPDHLVLGERPVDSGSLEDNVIRHDVRYSVQYDRNLMVSDGSSAVINGHSGEH